LHLVHVKWFRTIRTCVYSIVFPGECGTVRSTATVLLGLGLLCCGSSSWAQQVNPAAARQMAMTRQQQQNPMAQNQAGGMQNAQAMQNPQAGAGGAVAGNDVSKEEPTKEKKDSQELPKPQAVGGQELMTSDGVALVGTWFGSVRGKDAAPVLLLSGTNRSRNDYQKLAPFLQQQGFAVLAVNLRTAGNAASVSEDLEGNAEENAEASDGDAGSADTNTADSGEEVTEETTPETAGAAGAETDTTTENATTKKATENATTKKTAAKKTTPAKEERPWAKMKADDVAMIVSDIQACCGWLAQKNNAEELNLNKLCIVAADVNCIAAVDCVVQDWNREDGVQRSFTSSQPVRQSKFTKALVFLSPVAGVRGYDLTKLAMQNAVVEQTMPVMLFVGEKNKEDLKEAAKIRRAFEKSRRNEKELQDRTQKTFFYWECPTDTTGTAMLAADPKLAGWIAQFLRTKVGNVQIPWNHIGAQPNAH
ncbi:MAG: hypothetical protein PHE53_08630, partial [Thermoguttaceae bacterium]|nr:hypothetical protein [Thermoguttaceae bacterium]